MTDADDPRLRLPFDQYQRYRVAADLLALLGADKGVRLLEVGGAPGFVEQFLPETQLYVVDRYGEHEGRYAVADGARLPFADGSFDVVLTLDTLEHVPAVDRPDFLAECRRVSRDLVVLSAPHASDQVVLAEDALHAFIKARFGETFETLQEHRDRGLPEVDETVAGLSADGWSAAVLPSGFLPRWLLGMVFHHELLASGLPELPDLHAFYNATVSASDCREPAYRQVVVAGRARTSEELQRVTDQLRGGGAPGEGTVVLGAIGAAILARRLELDTAGAAQRARADAAELKVADLERQLADREAHLTSWQGRADQAQAELGHARDRLSAVETALELERRRNLPYRLVRRLRRR